MRPSNNDDAHAENRSGLGISKAAEGRNAEPLQLEEAHRKAPAAGSKRAAVLRALLSKSLNRFEAARECGDWVLNTTVSELCRDFRLEIPRQLETIPGRHGKPTEVARYRLSESDRVKVRALVGDA